MPREALRGGPEKPRVSPSPATSWISRARMATSFTSVWLSLRPGKGAGLWGLPSPPGGRTRCSLPGPHPRGPTLSPGRVPPRAAAEWGTQPPAWPHLRPTSHWQRLPPGGKSPGCPGEEVGMGGPGAGPEQRSGAETPSGSQEGTPPPPLTGADHQGCHRTRRPHQPCSAGRETEAGAGAGSQTRVRTGQRKRQETSKARTFHRLVPSASLCTAPRGSHTTSQDPRPLHRPCRAPSLLRRTALPAHLCTLARRRAFC